MLLSAIKFPMT